MVSPAPRARSRALRERDPSDPQWRAVELAQRARLIVDVAAADLDAAESTCGAFHPTAWHFRNAHQEALRSWDRLRAELGGATLKAALAEPPLVVMALGPGAEEFVPDRAGRWPIPEACTSVNPGPTTPVILIPIEGQAYRALRVVGTPLAPLLWRLTRLTPPLEDGPYYACRLRDRTTRCDCAEWTYRIAETDRAPHALCKHLEALDALGWL